MSKLLSFLIVLIGFFIFVLPANAHVVVKPNEVGIGAFQTFTIGVPVEKDMATTEIRLIIPNGLKHVTPNIKNGWHIEIKKAGEGEEAKISEIVWSANSIPAGFREDFQFSAQVPAEETTLQWKAYQTYEDGSIVAWDKSPEEESSDFSKFGPYSQTKTINDLKEEPAPQKEPENPALILSIIALALSACAISLQIAKKK